MATNKGQFNSGFLNVIQCPQPNCNRIVCGKNALANHILAAHKQEQKKFECEKCHKCFLRRSNLTQHLNIHVEPKPFKCHKCGRGFSLNCNMKRHLLTHEGTKNRANYQCNFCPKKYNDKSNLRRHVRTAHDDVDYSLPKHQRRSGRVSMVLVDEDGQKTGGGGSGTSGVVTDAASSASVDSDTEGGEGNASLASMTGSLGSSTPTTVLPEVVEDIKDMGEARILSIRTNSTSSQREIEVVVGDDDDDDDEEESSGGPSSSELHSHSGSSESQVADGASVAAASISGEIVGGIDSSKSEPGRNAVDGEHDDDEHRGHDGLPLEPEVMMDAIDDDEKIQQDDGDSEDEQEEYVDDLDEDEIFVSDEPQQSQEERCESTEAENVMEGNNWGWAQKNSEKRKWAWTFDRLYK
ncbi:unnamed protein product [Orchesella dallaii]|uniref:C2H2-type domain-containing protein n=1 Tax=Orchesella dallaii TaxID=48710 RepID=A0ABP1PWM2_9HEXA